MRGSPALGTSQYPQLEGLGLVTPQNTWLGGSGRVPGLGDMLISPAGEVPNIWDTPISPALEGGSPILGTPHHPHFRDAVLCSAPPRSPRHPCP